MKEKKTRFQAGIRRKFEFYRSVGYSEHASEVLSVFSYGDCELASFVNNIPQEDIIERIYSKFFKQDSVSPSEALDRYYHENRGKKSAESSN